MSMLGAREPFETKSKGQNHEVIHVLVFGAADFWWKKHALDLMLLHSLIVYVHNQTGTDSWNRLVHVKFFRAHPSRVVRRRGIILSWLGCFYL